MATNRTRTRTAAPKPAAEAIDPTQTELPLTETDALDASTVLPAEQAPEAPAAAAEQPTTEQPTLNGIVWEEPPARRTTRKSELQDMADALRANPEKWANMGERSTSVAYNIRKGQGAWAPAGAFETTTRAVSKTRANIYVRYVGVPQQG